jgi:hypothetical protein
MHTDILPLTVLHREVSAHWLILTGKTRGTLYGGKWHAPSTWDILEIKACSDG